MVWDHRISRIESLLSLINGLYYFRVRANLLVRVIVLLGCFLCSTVAAKLFLLIFLLPNSFFLPSFSLEFFLVLMLKISFSYSLILLNVSLTEATGT